MAPCNDICSFLVAALDAFRLLRTAVTDGQQNAASR